MINLPKPEIDRDLAMELWTAGRSDYAKEQVVLNNAGIVGIVLKSLNLSIHDEDLFATGLVGIVKAVNTFDAGKGFTFSAYATQVVRNEILSTFRKKRIIPCFSLDEPCNTGEEKEISYGETIADSKNFEEDIIADIHFKNAIGFMNSKERQVVFLRMNGKTQNQIAKICGISQARVSRISKRAYEKFKE